VVHGVGRGAKLGFPTANMEQVDTLLPSEGIYAGRAWVDKTAYAAAISIGPNPTFHEQALKVEVYLVDFEGNLYDQTIEVDFLARLRNMRRFDSADQLISQMTLDVEHTRRIHTQDSI